eukprot:CAMPEP_0197291654 /NCGR_PEP_ID=MMETSP0890-20130614/17987_1 /TAXON_ID=44058 ORGANISM="Aureoumbra lagunensis, Strain CCMP1510" /NCGR_SAMPLE_ID=MMETSP0890 /ASSEMBLY_ACC=CAM_ASM_000533 /LENGTH=153 /DNA_ID=CAMNT_0042764905 /DNA_START=184 /DNA_END=646 /DNA_ORIENTATION=-
MKFAKKMVAKVAFRFALGMLTGGLSETVLLPLDALDATITIGDAVDMYETYVDVKDAMKEEESKNSKQSRIVSSQQSRIISSKPPPASIKYQEVTDKEPINIHYTRIDEPAKLVKMIIVLVVVFFISWKVHQFIMYVSVPEQKADAGGLFFTM